jgi:hypothetical protein
MPSIQVHKPATERGDVKRPKAGGIAYPFSLKTHGATASMTTLTSSIGVPPADDVGIAGAKESGVESNPVDIEALRITGNRSEDAKTMIENDKPVEGSSTAVPENGGVAGSSDGT